MKKLAKKIIKSIFVAVMMFSATMSLSPAPIFADTVTDTYSDTSKINSGTSTGYKVASGQLKMSSGANTNWWKMDEASGISVADSSGNSSTGTALSKSIGWWKMDEASGAGVADYWGTTNGTATGTTVVAGQYSNARSFNGTSDWVNLGVNTVGPLINGASQVTVSAWVKPSAFPAASGSKRVLSINIDDVAAPVGVLIRIYNDAGTIKAEVGGRSAAADAYQNSRVNYTGALNEWHHIAGVLDFANDTITTYYDGTPGTPTSVTFANTTYTQGAYAANWQDTIGNSRNNTTNVDYFSGPIDNVMVYKYGRTQAEIQTDMNNVPGPTVVAGQYGNARSFNGSSDMILSGTSHNFTTQPFTVMMWVNPTNFTNLTVLFTNGSFQVDGYYAWVNTNGSIGFRTNQAGAYQDTLTAADAFTTGTWQHLAFVRNGSSVRIYKNGVDITSTAGTHINPVSTALPFTLGTYGPAPTIYFFPGSIDDVRIYDYARTQSQIEADRDNLSYDPTSTIVSTNLLSSASGVDSIDEFVYNLSAKPASTTATVQFSQNGSSWYNSAGTLDGTDTLTTGSNNTILIHSLGWSGSNFYYKIAYAGDGSDTPVLDDVNLNYTVSGYTDSSAGGTDSYNDSSQINTSSSTNENVVGGQLKILADVNVGDGADGAITVSANKNINTDAIAAGRTVPDGVNYGVSAIGTNTVTVGSPSTTTTGFWKMDESANDSCSGGQDACDSSSSGNHGVATGTSIVSAKYSNGRSFNGTTDYIVVNSAAYRFNSGDFTAEVWANPNALDATYDGLITVDSADAAWRIVRDTGTTYFKGTYAGTSANFPAVATGAWHHYAIVKSGTTLSLYFDGAFYTSATVAATHAGAATQMWFGSYRTVAQGHYFNGTMDDIRIYDYARTAAEIAYDTYPTAIAAGDEVLLINLRGDATNYANVGNYETLTVQSVSDSTVTFTSNIAGTYGVGGNADLTGQTIMIQRVPNYTDVTVNSGITLTASAWDGTRGGVLFFRASGTVSVVGNISANALGHRGGAGGANNVGGTNGESFDGYNGAGGTNAGAAPTNGGGSAGSHAATSPNNGAARGGGGGGGSGDANNDTRAGGGGAGGGYGGGGGGGGGAGAAGGAGGGAAVSAGGGGGSCNTSGCGAGGAAPNAGAAGASGAGGEAGSGTTGGSGGAGSGNANYAGAGGGGGGLYGSSGLADLRLGSGGGGGGGNDGNPTTGKAGGAGGGAILVIANDITVSGTVTSAGANGTTATDDAGAGGAGSGGTVLLQANNDATLGTGLVTATGGTGGTNSANGGGGGSGGVGRIGVVANNSVSGSTNPVHSNFLPSGSTYFTSATIISTNLLANIQYIKTINSFDYTLSLPANTAATVQFSQDGSNWYSSAGVAGGTDSLSAGANTISLTGLSWSSPFFYYKLAYTSDGVSTPTLDSVTVNYTISTSTAGSTWASCLPLPGGNFSITTNCYFPITGHFPPNSNIDGVDNGDLTIQAYKTLTIKGDQQVVRNSGKGVTIQNGASIAINDLPLGAVGGNVRDYSGSGNEGQAVGSTIVAGKYNRGRSFNGTSDWINLDFGTIGASLNTASAITFEGWINPSSLPTAGNRKRIMSVNLAGEVGAGSGFVLALYNDAGTVKVEAGGRSVNTDSYQTARETWSGGTGSWHHIAGVVNYATDTITVYIDGAIGTPQSVTFGNLSFTQATPTVGYEDAIGAYRNNSLTQDYWSGLIDDVRVYNYGLETTQIQDDMNNGSINKAAPVAWYRFEDGGQLKQSNLWVQDVDGDGWTQNLDTQQKARTNSPGTGWVRRNTIIGSAFGDGRDGNITFNTSTDLNVTNHAGRTCDDGGDAVNYSVTGFGSTTLPNGNNATTVTLSPSVSAGCLASGDNILLVNLMGPSTNMANRGNYEVLKVYSISGANLTAATVKRNYYGDGASDDTNLGVGATNQIVMLQRIPQYNNVTVNTGVNITPSAWDGTQGGVLAFMAKGTVTMNGTGTINADAKGYRGATAQTENSGGKQGESTTGNPQTVSNAANAEGGGGGGNRASAGGDSGGGGGGGYGVGGSNGHIGGSTAGGVGGGTYGNVALSKLYLGSGGGGGGKGISGTGQAGSLGGGIVLIMANSFTVGASLSADGQNATAGSTSGGGGGGSGGSVKLYAATLVLGDSVTTATGGIDVGGGSGDGGAGGAGRIAVSAGSVTGTTNPTYNANSAP